jgi:hypothetical protein
MTGTIEAMAESNSAIVRGISSKQGVLHEAWLKTGRADRFR